MSICDSRNLENNIDYYSIYSKLNTNILYRNLSPAYTKIL
jgi:hypothetical protein